MVTPGVGAWPEGCWPKARRQQWRHFGTSAMLGIGCELYGVGVHILFPADNAPSGTRNSSKRFGGDLGGERRADGRTPGDYHVARKARFEAKAWDQSRTGFRGRRVVMSLAGGASAAGAQVADALTHKAVVSHEITLGEEEIADVSYILCLRQGKCRTIAAQRKAGVWLLDGTHYEDFRQHYDHLWLGPLLPIQALPLRWIMNKRAKIIAVRGTTACPIGGRRP